MKDVNTKQSEVTEDSHNRPENDEELLSFINSMGISSELILKNASDPVIYIDRNGKIIDINPLAVVTLGYKDKMIIGQNLFDLVLPEYIPLLRRRMNRSFNEALDPEITDSGDNPEEELFLIRMKDGKGQVDSYECILIAYQEESGYSFFLNIWKPEQQAEGLESQLKTAHNNYEALMETITEAVIMVDESFKILYANSSTVRVFGYTKSELTGSPFAMLFPEEVFYRYSDEFRKYFYIDSLEGDEKRQEIELLARSKNRGISPVEVSFGISRKLEERTLICIIRDISQRKTVERKLRYLAFHDKLTELGNRDLFNVDIKEFFNTYRNHTELCGALLFLDLDGFKQVNDTLGHQAGDKLLIATARRLRSLMRESDMIYRFGGDEFVILLSKIHKKTDVETVCDKILRTIRQSYSFEKEGQLHKVNIGVSIGIALLPDHGMDQESITRNADLAMYSSKEKGKNRYTLFSEELTKSAQNKWIIDQGLKTALVNGEMFLVYQPIVDREQNTAGVEALIRWDLPGQGLISPEEFIPMAEESGVINSLGQWVLEHALNETNKLNENGFPDLYVSVNISTKQLKMPDFKEILERAITRSGMRTENLRLELTESFLMESPEKAIETLIEIKEKHKGIKIVIDDFGKGYSSLHYLSRLPVDVIKIDRSFIKVIPEKNNRKVITSIVNLATSLDLEMVVEGIETEEQQFYPPLESCHYLQGYLFSKPLIYNDFKAFLKS